MVQFDVPEPDYDRYTNRQLLLPPLALLAVAILILGGFWAATGSPANLGIEFTGGTELTVDTVDDRQTIESAFDTEPAAIRTVEGEDNRYIVRFGAEADDPADQAREALEPVPGDEDGDPVQGVNSFDATFAGDTQRLAIIGVVAAFLGMSVLAFLLFRTFVPSIAIVASAFSDLVIPLAAMAVLDIQLTLGTVAALLMLIGYSVDSDILLNNHVLRRGTRGDFNDDVYRAMETGVTMTVTSMAAMATMAVVSQLFGITLLRDIGAILFIGLAADLLNTYMMNYSLLRWYRFEGVAR